MANDVSLDEIKDAVAKIGKEIGIDLTKGKWSNQGKYYYFTGNDLPNRSFGIFNLIIHNAHYHVESGVSDDGEYIHARVDLKYEHRRAYNSNSTYGSNGSTVARMFYERATGKVIQGN